MNDVLPVASYLPRAARPPRSLAYHLFLATNPFYLLSAACMLAGCTALSNSLSWSPIKLNRLLMLIATLNIYELMLVGLGLYLLVVRRLRRDATILLILEAFFLADVTFLNHEIYAEDVRVGAIVNTIVLVLAFVKLAAIFRCLNVPLTSGPFALVMTQMTLLLAMPGVFRQIVLSHNNTMPPLAIYGAWWIVALLPILASVLLRDQTMRRHAPAWVRSQAIFGVLILLPLASILAHLCLANWVYNVRWYTANVSPVLLGLAVAIGGYDKHVASLAVRMRAQLALPAAAVVLSMFFPSSLMFPTDGSGVVEWAALSPLRLTMLASVLVYGYGYWLHRHLYFIAGSATCLIGATMGNSVPQMDQNVTYVSRSWLEVLTNLMPKSRMHWGFVAMGASFVLLLIGAGVSFSKGVSEESETTRESSN